MIVQYSMRLYINSSRELQEWGNKAAVCRDCVCVRHSLYVASLQQPIFYLISSVTLQSAGMDQYGSVLLQDAILFSWQQSCSQVVHSQNSLLIAPPHPFLLSVYVMEDYSKPLVLSFPNICFGFALKSWMSLPPPQFHRMTPIVQFCLIWEDILEQSGEGSHNSSACYVKLFADRKFHQQPWWCLVTVTWRNKATHSALQRQMSKLDCFWLLTFFMPL